MITYIILGVPYYSYSIIYPKALYYYIVRQVRDAPKWETSADANSQLPPKITTDKPKLAT